MIIRIVDFLCNHAVEIGGVILILLIMAAIGHQWYECYQCGGFFARGIIWFECLPR